MNSFRNIIEQESGRRLTFGKGFVTDENQPCPICGGVSWDYLLKDRDGDFVGCDDCVRRIYS